MLERGPSRRWDERAVADPYVIRIGRYFYMYYLGQDRAGRQRLGVARSADGVRWEKLRSNPVLELGGEAPSTRPGSANRRSGNRTASTGCCTPGAISQRTAVCGLARSTDGVHWAQTPRRLRRRRSRGTRR